VTESTPRVAPLLPAGPAPRVAPLSPASGGTPSAVLAALNAERIKLTTIRSPLWSAGVAAVLSLGVAALQGSSAYGAAGLPPEKAVTGVAVFGVPVMMVLSAMTMTGEYRSGTIRTTFAAIPNRTLVLVAKMVVAALFSAIFIAVMVIGSAIVAQSASTPLLGERLSLAEVGVWRLAGELALFAALAAVLGVAVGALLRYAAGAVAVLLLWPLVVEPILGNMPNLGSEVGPYLPFGNAFVFADVQWLYPVYSMPWDRLGSLLYFAVVVSFVFVAAVVVVNRRDA
jgi:ABC-2 type transport system permease protein